MSHSERPVFVHRIRLRRDNSLEKKKKIVCSHTFCLEWTKMIEKWTKISIILSGSDRIITASDKSKSQ